MYTLNKSVMFAILTMSVAGSASASPPPPPAGCSKTLNDCYVGTVICTQTVSPVWSSVSITPGHSLQNDGGGVYVNGVNSVQSFIQGALALFPTQPDAKKVARTMKIDLRYPADEVAVPMGIITDGKSQINAFWEVVNSEYQSPQNMEIGQTVLSSRVVIGLHYNNKLYALQIGPDPVGSCWTGGTAVHGAGTSQASITRASANTWVLDLPAGSTGRLFDVSGTFPNAIDKGLYYLDLNLTVTTP
jgi:hypothetical protein